MANALNNNLEMVNALPRPPVDDHGHRGRRGTRTRPDKGWPDLLSKQQWWW
jgi:hypothetical protein